MTQQRGFIASAFRQKRNLALGLASEMAAPLLRRVASSLSKGEIAEPVSWRKGLIIAHNHIGDVLYRTPSLQALRDGLPRCDWSFLTTPSSAEILKGNPNVSEVIPWNSGENSWDLDAAHKTELAARAFDVVLCTNTLLHYPDLILATTLGIPNRVGFAHKGLSGLITRAVRIDFPSPFPGYFRALVGDVIGRTPDWSLTPEIFLDEVASSEAQRVIAALGLTGDRPVVACCLTTRQPHGNWPADFMVSALAEARNATDIDIVLCGTAGDREGLNAIAAKLGGRVYVAAGDLSLRGFGAFLRECTALFTLDSGPRHLGNAVGTRVLFARNMSHSKIEAGKYCATEIDLAPDGEYLSDTEIQRLATATPVSGFARRLIETVQPGEVRA
ncbi:MAG TPA: glycosyltransferase family 9 protein [Gemmatimonadaceae bacterium]|nr:glycosyltransferase family 9 protein [Gemmatimonadaceae bacterium]